MLRSSVLVLALALAVLGRLGPADAADARGNFVVHGVGNQPCAVYLRVLQGDGAAAAAVFVGWLEGYTSAYNRLSDDTFDVVPIVEGALIAALVRNVCTRNPDAAVEAVLARVLRDLEPHRIRSESPIVTARAGDRSIALRQETLRRAQVRLAEKGHYRMAPDGLFGQGTQSALAAYQQAEGLAVTGLPDADTLARLILSSR